MPPRHESSCPAFRASTPCGESRGERRRQILRKDADRRWQQQGASADRSALRVDDSEDKAVDTTAKPDAKTH